MITSVVDLQAALKIAQPGDVLPLSGTFDHVFIKDKSWTGAGVTLDCTAAVMANVRMQSTEGVNIIGGNWWPNDYLGAIFIDRSHRISVRDVTVFGNMKWDGVTVRSSSDVSLTGDCRLERLLHAVTASRLTRGLFQGATVYGYGVDGMDFAGCHDVVVEYGTFTGGMIIDGRHPDAIQGWPIEGETPPSNFTIRKNSAHGHTQGFGFYNHDHGGFDNHVIEDNDICIEYPGAITLGGSRNSAVRRNRVRTRPGAEYRAKIVTDAPRTGNTVEAYRDWPSDNDPT